MPNKARAELARVMKGHLGYSREYPLAWNVKMYRGLIDPSGGVHKPEWDVNEEWVSVVEDLWNSLDHRDDEFPGKFYSEGRSSGYIVLSTFDGHVIGYAFIEELLNPESCIKNETCRRLLKMLPIWDEAFKDPCGAVNEGLEESYRLFLAEKKEQAYWEARDVETV